MRRFFAKNLLFVIAVNLLVKPVWVIVIDRTVQNRVGHEAYGTYQPLLNLSIIFQIILDMGLSYYNTKVVSQDPDNLKKLFPSLLASRLFLILIYGTISFSVGLSLGYRNNELLLLGGVIMIQALNSLMLFLRANVAALHYFKIDGILSVTDRLLMILLCGFLLFNPVTAPHFQIEWFVASQVVCYAIAVVIAFIVLGKVSGHPLRFSFDMSEVKKNLKASFPYAVLVFLMAVHMRSDSIFIERLCGMKGKDEAGIYAAGYRLLDVGNMFGIMFAGMLLPLFGKMLAEKQDVQPIVQLCVNMLLPVAFIAAVGSVFFGTPIMQMLYQNATEYDGTILAFLMATFPAFCMMYVYSTLLTANGNIKLLTGIALMGVIINLTMNFILIPQQKALGAAITTFITQTTLAACFIIFSGKCLQLPRNMKWIGAHIGFLLFVIALGSILHFTGMDWQIQCAVFCTLSLAAIFVFRFISAKSLKLLIKN